MPQTRPGQRALTRRTLFGVGAVGMAGVAVGAVGVDVAHGGPVGRGIAATTEPLRKRLAGPMEVITSRDGLAEGDLFVTDMGEDARLLILDNTGEVLWERSGAGSYADFRMQRYQGRDVLTWWESYEVEGARPWANGDCVIAEPDGTEVARIGAHGGLAPDEHEFFLTDRDTALIVSYVEHPADLTRWGGLDDDLVISGVVEEIDPATGEVLFHWDSVDHVGFGESFAGVPHEPDQPWDYFHINSVEPTPDGNLVVSARHTWGIYKIDRQTGEVIWRLGGKESDFDVPDEATFAWQHQATYEDDSLLRLFDNGSDGTALRHPYSQVLWLRLDEEARTLRLERSLRHPDGLQAPSMASAQTLPNGNVLVGWGSAQRLTEFSPTDEVLLDATLTERSYRVYRHVRP
ncbi:arylsulfotransferase family protein [Desertihabitans aurantiacus]|uniref:arylsulfotransferase family protein n=1 Tax=Desertihabitans aurantiacus TaxID=2282477 RepID=UPI000DF77B38|nr:arylsulfotransferase family protein [Desertihabitans aurantiacus]